MLVEVTEVQIRTMAEVLIGKHLASDLEDVYGERQIIANAPGIGEGAFASLAGLYKDLTAQEMGAASVGQFKENAVDTYLASRRRFIGGVRDEYGRPGYIQTIPSEEDSASADLIHNLECLKQDLIDEGPLFKVYRAKHKLGRFGLLRQLSGGQEGDFDESEVVEGLKIVVPSSPWAGFYTSLFVPDNQGRSYAWSYTERGKPFEEDFLHQVQSSFMEMLTRHNARTSDLALLYAFNVFSKMGHANYPRMSALVQGALGKVGVKNTEEGLKRVLEVAAGFPHQLTSAPQPHSEVLEIYQGTLADEDPVSRATKLLTDQGLHRDPGLLIVSLATLTEKELYKRFISLTYGAIDQQFQLLEGITELDPDKVGKLWDRHEAYMAFHNIQLPWQAGIVLGDERFQDLSQRMQVLDPEFNGLEFSLLHPPLEYLPPEAAEKVAYVIRTLKMISEGESSGYFDLEMFELACIKKAYVKR